MAHQHPAPVRATHDPSAVPAGSQSRRRAAPLLAFLGTVSGYVLSGLVMRDSSAGVRTQLLWPALGVAVGIAARWPRRAIVTAVGLGTLLGSAGVLAAAGWPARDAVTTALLVSVDLLILCSLLRLLAVQRLSRPVEVVGLLCASVAAAVAAAVSAVVLAAAGFTAGADGWAEGPSWLLGSSWGVVVFAPVIMTMTRPAPSRGRRAPEFAAATGLTLVAAFFLFSPNTTTGAGLLAWRYVTVVGLVWLAVRFGAAAVAPVLALVALYGAAPFTAKGVFAAGAQDPLSQVRLVQSSALLVGAAVLLLAVLFDERRRASAEQEQATRELRDQAARLAVLFEQSPTPAARVLVAESGEVQVLQSSLAMQRLVGVNETGADAAQLRLRVVPEDRAEAWSVITDALRRQEPRTAEIPPQSEVRLLTAAGDPVTVLMSAAAIEDVTGTGRTNELIVHAVDISARRQAEQALTEQALTDAVTGLPNRHALQDRLATALHRLERAPGVVGVLFCDIDLFKQVNDILGHQAGDLLLREVAGRLASAIRPTDTVARVGGDEFVVLCEGCTHPSQFESVALRIRDRVSGPWTYHGQVFHPAMSIGITGTSDPDASMQELLRRADVAMYQAKDAGRDRIAIYERSADDEMVRSVAMQRMVRASLDSDGFVLHYQPVVNLRGGHVIGAEALIRMKGADSQLIPPAEFIPYAEASELIARVGTWVLGQAFTDLRDWRSRGFPYQMNVNVSPRQLASSDFGESLLDEAVRAGVDPTWVCVEITETALLHHNGHAPRALQPLQEAGVSIALDDFGTGFSSLAWLTALPVDIVKIDGSFTRQLGTDPRRTAIISAIVGIANELGLTATAEGVETTRQKEMLLAMGCPEGQGYLLGRPVPIDDPSWT